MAALLAALEDREAAVRTEVVAALGEFEDPLVIRALVGALRDSSEAVQELALQSLKKVGDASVIEPIAAALLRGSPGVQCHAAQALRALGWVPRTLGEQIPYYVANGDFKRVAMFGAAAVNALAAVLRGGSDERRVAARDHVGRDGQSRGDQAADGGAQGSRAQGALRRGSRVGALG